MRRSFSLLSRRSNNTCSIFQIPLSLGQPLLGTCSAPQELMEAGLVSSLSELGWRIDIVNPALFEQSKYSALGFDANTNPRNCKVAGKAMQDIEKSIYEYAKQDNFLLMLGGDHCIPIGTIAAIKRARPNTGVVWVDAHADINTPATSHSGNLHGMPLAFLLGLVDNVRALPSFEYFTPCLQPADIVYIGLRDVDNGEKKFIKNLGIKAFTMQDIDRWGIGKVMDMAVAHLGDRDLHLSFDVDAMDPFFAPSTGTTVRGGLNFREGCYVCEALFETNRLRSMDLVEVNPLLAGAEDAKSTVSMGVKLCTAAMGMTIL